MALSCNNRQEKMAVLDVLKCEKDPVLAADCCACSGVRFVGPNCTGTRRGGRRFMRSWSLEAPTLEPEF